MKVIKLLITRMYVGSNSACVIKLKCNCFCYSFNITQLIKSTTIPNEICRNDIDKVLKGIWQAKPWALRSKYLLNGCENVPILLCAS